MENLWGETGATGLRCHGSKTALTQDRTGDLQIFSLTLSQLSYQGFRYDTWCLLINFVMSHARSEPITLWETMKQSVPLGDGQRIQLCGKLDMVLRDYSQLGGL